MCQCTGKVPAKDPSLIQKILTESWKSFSLVAKFMALAFLINALIKVLCSGKPYFRMDRRRQSILCLNRFLDWHTFLHNQFNSLATGKRINHTGYEPGGRTCLSYCRSGNNPACHDGCLGHCKAEGVFYVSDIRTNRVSFIRIPV